MMVWVGLRRSFWFLMLAIFVAGCSSTMGDRLGDFRAYYNTFYNAEQAFEEAVADHSLENEEISQSHFVRLRPSPAQVTRDDLLEDAIAKSADILRDYSESRYVYPALMLIGKSFYYQENYAGAEQNFREIIERDETRRQEAHDWLARTLLEAGRYDEALAHVTEHRNRVSDEYRAGLELTAAQIEVRQGNWQAASVSLVRALEEDLDRMTRAHTYLLLGQVREAQNLYSDAAQAYEQAAQLRASDQSSYHALIGKARSSTETGAYRAAEQLLADALREQRHPNREAALRFWQGYLAMLAGKYEDAITKWQQVSNDEDLNVPRDIQERTQHALGEVYRDHFQDYAQAAEHFEAAAAALDSDEEGSSWLTGFAVTGSRTQADRFAEVAEATHRMNHLDSLLTLGELDDASFEQFIEARRAARMQELEEARQAASPEDQWDMAGGVTEGAASTEDAVDAAGDAGFLFYRDPSRVQEIQTRFSMRWGDRPHVPNWRRQEAVTAVAQTPSGVVDDMLIEEGQPQDIRVLDEELGLEEIPRDAASRDAMRRELAEAKYQLGNALFLSIERPDSALYWYEAVLESEHVESISVQARYAKAEAYSSLNQPEMARPLYEEVAAQTERPELARRASERLGTVEVPEEASTTVEDRYQEAYAKWEGGIRPEALEDLLGIYGDHTDSRVAPRSLFAAGHVAIEMAQYRETPLSQANQWVPDSLRTAAPDTLASINELIGLAHAVWKELVDTYPESPHANRATHLTQALGEPHRRTYLAQRLRFDDAAPDISLEQMAVSAAEERSSDAATADHPDGVTEVQEDEPERAQHAAVTGDELVTDEPIDNELGGWTIVVSSGTTESVAHAEASYWEAEGYRATVLPYEDQAGDSWYRVAIGQMTTLQRAHELLDEYQDRFPGESWVFQLDEAVQEEGAEAPAPEDESSPHPSQDEELASEEGVAAQPEEALHSDLPDTNALVGDEPLDLDDGGWVIIVDSQLTRATAEAARQQWREAGYRAGLLPYTTEDGEERYRVAVGQMATLDRAQELLDENEGTFPPDSWLLNLSSERN